MKGAKDIYKIICHAQICIHKKEKCELSQLWSMVLRKTTFCHRASQNILN